LKITVKATCSASAEKVLALAGTDFRRSAAGRIASAQNHLGGERLFGSMLRRTLKAVEHASAGPAQSDTAQVQPDARPRRQPMRRSGNR